MGAIGGEEKICEALPLRSQTLWAPFERKEKTQGPPIGLSIIMLSIEVGLSIIMGFVIDRFARIM